ncbi:MAG: 2-aminoethylphosphonate ABC transporter permease subunit [Rhodobacteraceae bacterium]|nr:2-aminoethylphosphonate ABC transporter permease subunit [Paracoccaceae bacterium]
MAETTTAPRPVVATHGLWVVLPFAILCAAFLYPLFLIALQAVTGPDGALSLAQPLRVLTTPAFWRAFLNTIEIAVSASAGCVGLGLGLAILLSFVPFPGSRTAARLIETFVALPTFLVALAFTFLYGSAGILNETATTALGLAHPPVDFLYSRWGVVLAEVTVYTPFALRPLLAAFSLIDAAQIEVASSLGAKPLRILRQVILPAALPALLAGGSLCLLLTVNEFGVVLFIGAKGVITLPLMIYDKAIQEFDYPSACVVAVVNVALSLGLFSAYRLIVARIGGRHAGVV